MTTTLGASMAPPQGQTASPRVSLEEILDDPRLPTPPALALQIIDQASKPNCSPKDILNLLRQDPGLCGKVLKTINSSAFALPQAVTTLERAVALLGIKPLRSLVLGLSLPALHAPSTDPDVTRYWQESVAGAVIARELAVRLRRPQADEDLVTALLRDLGVRVLQEVFPEEYAEFRASSRSTAGDVCASELESFGVDHAEISAGILESWRMPDTMLLPVRFHHSPERLPATTREIEDRTWLLYFATKLARVDGLGADDLEALLRLANDRFGMDSTSLGSFLETATSRIGEFAQVLAIDIGQCPNFAAIVAAGTSQLMELAVRPAEIAVKSNPPGSAVPSPLEVSDLQETHAFNKDHTDTKLERPNLATPARPTFAAAHLEGLPAGGVWLNDYHVQEILGRGAMGVVFKAIDPSLGRTVAIKMLSPERLVSSQARERFYREARAAAAIQHQNIVTIYAVQEMGGFPFLVMEYVPGALQDRLDKEPRLPVTDIIDYAYQIAAGLGAAHRRGVVHRDIKPANILLDANTQTLKISDFGLARVSDGLNLSQDGQWMGTPLFMAPEQFDSKTVDQRADLFSLGSVLYLLCTGFVPYDGDNIVQLIKKLADGRPKPISAVRSDVPRWFEQLIARCHVKNPAGRIASAADVLQTIESNAGNALRRSGGGR